MGHVQPLHEDRAVKLLVDSQDSEGHWGIAWEYYGTPYYPMVPILEALAAENGSHRYDTMINKAQEVSPGHPKTGRELVL